MTTTEKLREHYDLKYGGPNPYFSCKKCGAVEPGLLEYLEAHLKECKKNDVRSPAER